MRGSWRRRFLHTKEVGHGSCEHRGVPRPRALAAAPRPDRRRSVRAGRAAGGGDGPQARPVRDQRPHGHRDRRRRQGPVRGRGRVGHRLRQGRVQPQGLQRHGLVPALHRREVRRLRVDRRRLVHRLRQGRARGGRPRRAQHQRVPGHQRLGEARQPAAHRDQHHRRHRLGDHAVLRDHRHHLRERSAQVGRLRPGDHDHAGHQRPRADDDPAAADRCLHGLRHPRPRHRELHEPRGDALDHARVPARRADGRGEPARGGGQPAQRRRP